MPNPYTPTDRELLRALLAYAPEWTTADLVARTAAPDIQSCPSVIGVGRRLSRMAREGFCEARSNGYMNYYRAVE